MDEYNLQRFVEAQEGVHELAIAGLHRHSLPEEWVSLVFPPMAMVPPDPANPFALCSVDEAEAYLEHFVLGNRYREAVGALASLSECTVVDLFGESGADTVHSSLTLFALASAEPLIRGMISVWYGGLRHDRTIEALGDNW